MTLSASQIETFKVALGMSNMLPSMWGDRAAMAEAGDDLVSSIVTTHETLADHEAARRRPPDFSYTVDGSFLHVWEDVQFQKGQPRHTVYFMQFDGIAAVMKS